MWCPFVTVAALPANVFLPPDCVSALRVIPLLICRMEKLCEGFQVHIRQSQPGALQTPLSSV